MGFLVFYKQKISQMLNRYISSASNQGVAGVMAALF
jgi:hypothetical protein